jgi:threonine synthase
MCAASHPGRQSTLFPPVNRHLVCPYDARQYPLGRTRWRCDCGGPLDLTAGPGFDPSQLHGSSLWRYRHTFGLPGCDRPVSMGEGQTPLLVIDPHRPPILAKLDFLMPTLSFKDRGAAVLVSVARALGAEQLVADSSGNAGAAIAAYAARAGLPCRVFVPDATSPQKLAQLRAHGAVVERVTGGREEAASAAAQAVDESDGFYASHVWHPAFFEGTKTFAYEAWEQLGQRPPDEIFLPVGNGTLLIGTALGFADLQKAGLIRSVPRLIAVQASACNPLERAWRTGATAPPPVACRPTMAEGIAIEAPVRGRQVLEAVRASGGRVIAVGEDAIVHARASLAAAGLYVEPTAAAVYAGLLVDPPVDRLVLLPLCGAGLKQG